MQKTFKFLSIANYEFTANSTECDDMFRRFIRKDVVIDKANVNLEVAKILAENLNKTVFFKKVHENGREFEFSVVGNYIPTRERLYEILGVSKENYCSFISEKLKKPIKPVFSEETFLTEEKKSLKELPILRHFSRDAGKYITSGVVVAEDEEFGYNASIHRLLVVDDRHMVIRLVERDLYRYYIKKKEKNEPLEVAICIGCEPAVLFASAFSLDISKSELDLAGSIKNQPVKLVYGEAIDLAYPEAEIVIEARILPEYAEEGPFVDITGTLDAKRMQPLVEVLKIKHRKNAIYHAILPSGNEHKVLMGMPREPAIYHAVKEVADVKNVCLTIGSCSWLHCVVSIKKRNEKEPKEVIEKVLEAHSSVKHVVVVDDDIDIFDPNDVEYAIATRFQGDRDLYIYRNMKGSSLDPSSLKTGRTTKLGIDATAPLSRKEDFIRVKIGE